MQREVAFLAVDEIQLCADHERGHVFTDRLLHARGSDETMFLGSDTIRPILQAAGARGRDRSAGRASRSSSYRRRQQAAPAAAAQRRRRLLRGRGLRAGRGDPPPEGRGRRRAGRPLAAHPQRPGRDVPGGRGRASGGHRRHRHGPQHGRGPRRLRRACASSTAASTAGCARPRWRRSPAAPGATWPTAPSAPPTAASRSSAREIEAIESHSFPPLKALRWRNSELDFAERRGAVRQPRPAPPAPDCLVKVRDALDRPQPRLPRRAATRSARRAERPERVRLLWQVCQIPDFRKTLTDAHLHLLATVFRHLTGRRGVLPNDWVGDMIAQLERIDGDIDALVTRIAHVRTWTYMSHRAELAGRRRALAGAGARGRGPAVRRAARAADPALRRPAHLGPDALAARPRRARGRGRRRRRGRGRRPPGRPDRGPEPRHRRGRARRRPAPARRRRPGGRRCPCCAAGRPSWSPLPTTPCSLGDDDTLRWRGAVVARLRAGATVLAPRLELRAAIRHSTPRPRTGSGAGSSRWLDSWIDERLGALARLRQAARGDGLDGAGRGIAFRLVEQQGAMRRERGRQPDPRPGRRPTAGRWRGSASGSASITSSCRICSSRPRARRARACCASSTAGRSRCRRPGGRCCGRPCRRGRGHAVVGFAVFDGFAAPGRHPRAHRGPGARAGPRQRRRSACRPPGRRGRPDAGPSSPRWSRPWASGRRRQRRAWSAYTPAGRAGGAMRPRRTASRQRRPGRLAVRGPGRAAAGAARMSGGLRLDKWLWQARFIRNRAPGREPGGGAAGAPERADRRQDPPAGAAGRRDHPDRAGRCACCGSARSASGADPRSRRAGSTRSSRGWTDAATCDACVDDRRSRWRAPRASSGPGTPSCSSG